MLILILLVVTAPAPTRADPAPTAGMTACLNGLQEWTRFSERVDQTVMEVISDGFRDQCLTKIQDLEERSFSIPRECSDYTVGKLSKGSRMPFLQLSGLLPDDSAQAAVLKARTRLFSGLRMLCSLDSSVQGSVEMQECEWSARVLYKSLLRFGAVLDATRGKKECNAEVDVLRKRDFRIPEACRAIPVSAFNGEVKGYIRDFLQDAGVAVAPSMNVREFLQTFRLKKLDQFRAGFCRK
jgi:hypothetical protein